MGFPCNQFGAQEPKSNAEILEFVTSKYDVSFPMFAKIEVNGEGAAPLYTFLQEAQPNADGSKPLKWNFEKFLVDREGVVQKRYGTKVTPEEIAADIAHYLSV